jgi:outer membrane biosynthesis protein TonB
MNKVFLFLFLLAFSFELIIKKASEPQCDIKTGKSTFNIKAEEEENGEINLGNSAISLLFYLKGTNSTNRYTVQCSIPIHIQDKNGTEIDDDTKEEEKEEKEDKEEKEEKKEKEEKEDQKDIDEIEEEKEKEEKEEKEKDNIDDD